MDQENIKKYTTYANMDDNFELPLGYIKYKA